MWETGTMVIFSTLGAAPMLVFGKKCPACGSSELIAKSGASRQAALPVGRPFSCSDCRQQLVYVFPVSIAIDHRQWARRQLPPYFLIRIPGRTDQYARIRNISEGGVCFDHHYNSAPLGGRSVVLDLYNCNDGSSLEQLPAEIVASNEQLLEVNGFKTTVFNTCARFRKLSQAQRKVLVHCIQQYGT